MIKKFSIKSKRIYILILIALLCSCSAKDNDVFRSVFPNISLTDGYEKMTGLAPSIENHGPEIIEMSTKGGIEDARLPENTYSEDYKYYQRTYLWDLESEGCQCRTTCWCIKENDELICAWIEALILKDSITQNETLKFFSPDSSKEEIMDGMTDVADNEKELNNIVDIMKDRCTIDSQFDKEISVESLKNAKRLCIEDCTHSDCQLLRCLTWIEELELYLDGRSFSDPTGLEFITELPLLRVLILDLSQSLSSPLSLEPLNRCSSLHTLSVMGGPDCFDLSEVHDLCLDEFRITGYSAAQMARMGTADYLCPMGMTEGFADLTPMRIKTLNLNNAITDPPSINLKGIEDLSDLENLMVDDCTVQDFAPVLKSESLRNLTLSLSATEKNASAWSELDKPVIVTEENSDLLDRFDWNIPLDDLKAFLSRESSRIVLFLRYQ